MGVELFLSERAISDKVKLIASRISNDYLGKNLVVIGILKGAWVFMADLVRAINGVEVRCDFLKAESYGKGVVSSGEVKLKVMAEDSIKGNNILLVEDIIDTGLTLKAIKEHIEGFKPNSVKICALLDKPSRRKVEIKPDYVGFTIPDAFVVGYGLDYAEQYRNLPYIGIVKVVEQ